METLIGILTILLIAVLVIIVVSFFIFLAMKGFDKEHLKMMKENMDEEEYDLYKKWYKNVGGIIGMSKD